jgi:hypothetical protein
VRRIFLRLKEVKLAGMRAAFSSKREKPGPIGGAPRLREVVARKALEQGGGEDSQDKAIMEAIHDEEFTEPVNAEDWDAYIYDLAFCLERKLGVYL